MDMKEVEITLTYASDNQEISFATEMITPENKEFEEIIEHIENLSKLMEKKHKLEDVIIQAITFQVK